MRLFLFIDPDWPDTDATPVELVAQVRPDVVLVESISTLACWTETERAARFTVETIPRNQRPAADVALVFACGTDPMRYSRKAIAAGVTCTKGKIPVVAVRARRGPSGELAYRIDVDSRSADIADDLGNIRLVLLALHRACPELQPQIAHAGHAVATAISAVRWESVATAWSAVEKLRIEQPRVAPWLVTPDRLLAGWTAHLG